MTDTRSMLQGSDSALVNQYNCVMLDLDGVVYVGSAAVAGVADVLGQVRDRGVAVAFVTNNASRTPQSVAEHLRELGVEATAADVVTSAQAAASELAQRFEAGSRVLVVGGEGLRSAVTDAGLEVVESAADDPLAVVQGFGPSVGWAHLAEAAKAIRSGALWVACNLDLTVPTSDGIAPGNGTLVNAVAAAVGSPPAVVAGKPCRPLFDETVRRLGCARPIVVGDRLDTDIEGANNCGADSLLVMTGVTDLTALCAATSKQRPSYVSWRMDGLLEAHRVPRRTDDVFELRGWRAKLADGHVQLQASGADRSDGLRVVVSAAWSWCDDHQSRAPATVEAEMI